MFGKVAKSEYDKVLKENTELKNKIQNAVSSTGTLTHNSKLHDPEQEWSTIDKTKLPKIAFAGQTGTPSEWSYPHHWVVNGSDPDVDGRFTKGDMYLHKGGLDAAWAAANGAHSGQKASQEIIDHLEAHRKILGISDSNTNNNNNNLNSGTMKIKVKSGWNAITNALGFDATKENELTEESFETLNTKLQESYDQNSALTTKCSDFETKINTLESGKTKTEEDLATATAKVTTQETKIADLEARLEKKPGAEATQVNTEKYKIDNLAHNKEADKNLLPATEKK